ncbi:MAG: hypothetical protein WCJ30_08185 [Deltaproteobacteria bacterium]
MPVAKRSTLRSTATPVVCSGAMYAILPFTWPSRVELTRSSARAMPKSVMREMPSMPTRTLWGDTSRCTSRSGSPESPVSACAACSPLSMSSTMRRTIGAGIAFPALAAPRSRLSSVSPSMNSITR